MAVIKTKSQEIKHPEISIGLIGHVDHGKTTLLEKLSGKWTDTHSEEIKKGITIKLGYADVTIYQCKKHLYSRKKCCDDSIPLRTISFIDAPGHETLMATMLSGAAIMDGALLLIAANEACPQPQTKEHLMALEIVGIKNIIIIQNKIDIVTKDEAIENYLKIKEFVKGSVAENAPIIPVSALHEINIERIFEAIQEYIPTPKRDLKNSPLMLIARSFDINKPGAEIEKLVGGVLGGAVKQGEFSVGDPITILPGQKKEVKNQIVWVPYTTNIIDIKWGGPSVEKASVGGSVAFLTALDPSIIKSDQLTGNVVCLPNKCPPVWYDLNIEAELLKRVVGTKEETDVSPVKKGEALMLNVNAATTAGVVLELQKNKFLIKLKRPVCADKGSKVAISRLIGTRWRLIGTGIIS